MFPCTCAVLRGDVNSITVGARSNIQDGSVLRFHKTAAKPEGSPLVIGEDVTVGHKVMLHGCRIGNRVLVGMGSTVLDDAVIEDDVMIGAGSLVPPRKRLEGGYLYIGSPVRQVRLLTDEEKPFEIFRRTLCEAVETVRDVKSHRRSCVSPKFTRLGCPITVSDAP